MLQLNVSNSLEQLALTLERSLRRQQPPVFQPHYVVTQTDGMNNWLKIFIASRSGIAANIQFLRPNDIIHKVYFLLGGEFSDTLSAHNLSWLLFTLLEEEAFKSKFPSVAAYYSDDHPNKAVKRMALAEKVADLFDQYQIYRPDMIALWNGSALNTVPAGEWQQYLWIRAKRAVGGRLADKTLMGDFILKALKQKGKGELLRSRMPVLHLFGLSITTDYHLKLFEALGKHIDIAFHLLNPAPSVYWFDTISEKQQVLLARKGLAAPGETAVGNTLLTTWGRVIKDTFGLLFGYEEFMNAYEEVGVQEPGTDTLLQKLQHNIFYNLGEDEQAPVTVDDLEDGSLTINSCYTIAREVEVLYNYLVHLVDRRKEALSPRDIVVMVSDIDAYAPYIKAVFGNAPYAIPFSLADDSYTGSDNIINALKAVMELKSDSFKAEEVVQLLDSAFIRRRFGLTNLALVRRVVQAANIRFGTDGRTEDDTVFVSWRHGLQRILYGLCLGGEEEYEAPEGSLYPLDLLEGSEATEIIRFCHFVQVLIESVERRRGDRPITDWVAYVNFLLHNLVYEAAEAVDEEYSVLRKQLEAYNLLHEYLHEPVSYEVFCHSFLGSVTGATRAASFAGGGITFCSLIPMRSIPFKVVALLGLSFDKFPRRETRASFNLMDRERRKGDRSIRENDKHLFLETVLSARDYLYVSYLGQSVRDNTALPPSALVDELIDSIEAACDEPEEVRKRLITRQPLHGFSRQYMGGDGRLYSYLLGEKGSHTHLFDAAREREPLRLDEVSPDALVAFFKNPFKAYYNRVLAIYYGDGEELLPGTELFALDTLQQWSLKHELLRVEEEGWEAHSRRGVKTGRLPLKNMAGIILQQSGEVVRPVRRLLLQTTEGLPVRTAAVDVAIGDTGLKGTLEGVYGARLVVVSFSRSEGKYLLEAYIRYLAGRAAGVVDEVYFISSEKSAVFKGRLLSTAEAQQRLAVLLQLYKRGHERILAFYPDFKPDLSKISALDRKGFDKLVTDKLDNYNSPCTDTYILNEFQNGFFTSDEVLEEYKANCRELLLPLAEVFADYFE
ncbi:exodeoxyribonuclease V subunit gamma [Paraflavisolibacter sp. H34]|uniref:exodeoxyribonuclease V subunit gamma n=1 Tax=Huijunlia imazamoxiresistens TaxID=3127457 RepID=UPI00301758A7